MLDEIEKAPRAGSAFSELTLHADGAGNSGIKPLRQNTQIKFQDDAEIALDLAAHFLNLTAQYAAAGDYLSLDRNRRRAAWIGAEAFLRAPP